jgi:hypothetical protein
MELARLYSQIALLRRGPQDIPGSLLVLIITVVAYFIVNFGVSWALRIEGPWELRLLVDVLFTLAWYALLLRIFNRRERFVQTTSAVFGYQAILSPLWLMAVWLLRRSAENASWHFPVSLLGLILVVWMITVNANILKAALEWAMPACVLLVIGQIVVSQALFYLLTGEGG